MQYKFYKQRVSLSKISSNPFYIEHQTNIFTIARLSLDIKNNGLKTPIRLAKFKIVGSSQKSYTYLIISGFNEYKAMKLLEMEFCEALVTKNLSKKDLVTLMIQKLIIN